MQVTIETTSPVDRRLNIGVPKERIEPEIQQRLHKLVRTARVNGFRPGKVPLRVVEQKFGEQVRDEVLSEVLQSSFQEALVQENLHPVSQPNFEVNEVLNPEDGFTYTAAFKVNPEIKSLQVESLPVDKLVATVTESDIEVMLERLRKQRQSWLEKTSEAELGDRVTIDFVGTVDGRPFEGNEIKQLPLVLGQNEFMLPDMENKLVGVRAGDDRELSLTFPHDHKNPQLAGQTVHFRVHVSSVALSQLPELDSELAKSLGVEDGSLVSLRREARENMERELEFAIKVRIKYQLLDGLLKVNPIYAPENLVAEEAQRLLSSRQKSLPKQYASQLSVDMFQEEAEKRVKLGLLVGELVRRNNIQVDPARVRQMVVRIASTYEEPENMVNWYYADQQRLSEINSMVLEDQVVDWLLERAQITEQPSDFYSVMAPPAEASSPQVALGN
jgi:trigger factor